ncbi:MAG: NUDIX domain-containing protein [Bacteroidales bacterium]|nr:NUDIX domain-containing protein [Bacteroidales bacterium]
MNLSLLKKMLPGLIPLLIFILADEIWGTMVGLYVALGFGIAEFLFYYIKDKIIDRFILLDTLLLVALGGISIAFENDLFFKVKPALIEAILLAVIAFSLWGPKNILMAMSERYMGELQLDPMQEKSMRNNMVAVFWITVLHIVLVLYSAFYMSKEAWFFISGGLYYIFFGLFFAFMLLKNRLMNRRYKNEEWFPIVNSEGKVLGKAPRSVCHDGKSMLLHPVVHLHIFDKSGELYLQKRSMKKDTQPGKWDTSVGGHISPGETVARALVRESLEELGLNGFVPRFLGSYVWESSRERELVNSFSTVTEIAPVINRDEIDEGRFWSIQEIRNNLGKEVFTPNFENEFMKFFAQNVR